MLIVSILSLSNYPFRTIMSTARKPRKKANGASDSIQDYPQKLQAKIRQKLISNGFGNKFLPKRSIAEVVDGIDFNTLLPRASPDLIAFVRIDAAKVLLTTLLTLELPSQDLVKVMEKFKAERFTDKTLPVEDISKCKRCVDSESLARCICSSCDEFSRNYEGDFCPHDVALDLFHEKPWSHMCCQRFCENQWMFLAHVFKKSVQPELPEETVLPFTRKSSVPRSGHFSNVYEATLHADYQDEFKAVRSRNDPGLWS